MIFFVAPEDDSSEMREFMEIQGHLYADRIRPLTYEEITIRRELPLGTYIFAAIVTKTAFSSPRKGCRDRFLLSGSGHERRPTGNPEEKPKVFSSIESESERSSR